MIVQFGKEQGYLYSARLANASLKSASLQPCPMVACGFSDQGKVEDEGSGIHRRL